MPLWKVERDSADTVISASKLSDGREYIAFGGLTIPVTVEGDELRVHAKGIHGSLVDGFLWGVTNDNRSQLLSKLNKNMVKEVVFTPEEGRSVLTLFGRKQTQGRTLNVERSEGEPKGIRQK